MHPLYPPCLDDSGTGDNLCTASWKCYKKIVAQVTKFVHCSRMQQWAMHSDLKP